MDTKGKAAVVRAGAGAGRCAGVCGWRCRCLLEVVTGSKVTCEGTGLKEVWSELEGGSGAEDVGQQESGTCVVLPSTGELVFPWQEQWRRLKPMGNRKGERVTAGMRGTRPCLCRI